MTQMRHFKAPVNENVGLSFDLSLYKYSHFIFGMNSCDTVCNCRNGSCRCSPYCGNDCLFPQYMTTLGLWMPPLLISLDSMKQNIHYTYLLDIVVINGRYSINIHYLGFAFAKIWKTNLNFKAKHELFHIVRERERERDIEQVPTG